jgi:hypothetical protein
MGFIVMLFRSGSTSAIYTNYVQIITPYGASVATSIPFCFDQPSGTTEEITYTVELGSTSIPVTDWDLNPYGGGTVHSSLRITEIRAD